MIEAPYGRWGVDAVKCTNACTAGPTSPCVRAALGVSVDAGFRSIQPLFLQEPANRSITGASDSARVPTGPVK
jgi:hypothetical protein